MMRVELPSHMVHKHGWDKKRAATVNCLTNQRKHYSKKKWKMIKGRQQCPVIGCSSIVLSIRDHNRNKHPNLIQKKQENIITRDFYPHAPVNILTETIEEPVEIPPATDATTDCSRDTIESALSEVVDSVDLIAFTASNSKYQIPRHLKEMIEVFGLWVTGPQGGGNKHVTSRHNTGMISRICEDLNAVNLRCLLDDSRLWRLFLKKKEDGTWSGQTARSYMVAIKKFMMFIMIDSRKGLYTTQVERDYARDINTDVGNWSKSYKNQIGLESARKKIKHADSLIDPAKVNAYKASEQYRTAVTLFGTCHEPSFQITARRFALLRAFLLFNINLRNANRAGVLAEMTVQNFNERKKAVDVETGCSQFMVTIVEHKTLATSGPAKLSLSGQLELFMSLYLTNIRSKVTSDEGGFFFTTFKGTPLASSSSIANYLGRFTSASGIGRMTSNDFRRSATTITRMIDPSMNQTVADHLNHSLTTADKVYNIKNKDVKGFRAAAFLQDIYDGQIEGKKPIEFSSCGEITKF